MSEVKIAMLPTLRPQGELDLDDLRSEMAEHPCGYGPGYYVCQVQDPDTSKGKDAFCIGVHG